MTKINQQTSRSLTSVMLAADAVSARIVGLTSERAGAGVSLAAQSLARAYASFGRRTLLIEIDDATSQEAASPVAALRDRRPSARPGLSVAKLSTFPMETDPNVYRRIFEAAASDQDVVIVDLLPVAASTIRSPAETVASVAACDTVFLIGLTGEADRESLGRCVETCRIGGVKLGGVILNDWKMPASNILILEKKKAAAEGSAEYEA